MGRKLPYDRVEWKISLPAHVAARVELRLPAPAGGKPRYGARSRLVEQLLDEWLKDLDNLPQLELEEADV